ncbi:hypothetical protein Droror1_Dr00028283 [Drosera rotundifolia]
MDELTFTDHSMCDSKGCQSSISSMGTGVEAHPSPPERKGKEPATQRGKSEATLTGSYGHRLSKRTANGRLPQKGTSSRAVPLPFPLLWCLGSDPPGDSAVGIVPPVPFFSSPGPPHGLAKGQDPLLRSASSLSGGNKTNRLGLFTEPFTVADTSPYLIWFSILNEIDSQSRGASYPYHRKYRRSGFHRRHLQKPLAN